MKRRERPSKRQQFNPRRRSEDSGGDDGGDETDEREEQRRARVAGRDSESSNADHEPADEDEHHSPGEGTDGQSEQPSPERCQASSSCGIELHHRSTIAACANARGLNSARAFSVTSEPVYPRYPDEDSLAGRATGTRGWSSRCSCRWRC